MSVLVHRPAIFYQEHPSLTGRIILVQQAVYLRLFTYGRCKPVIKINTGKLLKKANKVINYNESGRLFSTAVIILSIYTSLVKQLFLLELTQPRHIKTSGTKALLNGVPPRSEHFLIITLQRTCDTALDCILHVHSLLLLAGPLKP